MEGVFGPGVLNNNFCVVINDCIFLSFTKLFISLLGSKIQASQRDHPNYKFQKLFNYNKPKDV